LSGYFFVTSYIKFEQARALEYTLKTNTKLSRVLNQIQKERDLTTLYIENYQSTYIDVLKKQHIDTDREILKIQNLSPQPNIYLSLFEQEFKKNDRQINYNYIALLKNLKTIHTTRNNVAQKKRSFSINFFQDYTQEQTSRLLYHMSRVKNYTLSEQITQLAYLLANIYSTREYTSLERGYVTYFLHNNKAMSHDEYKKWHKFHNLASHIDFKEIYHPEIKKNLNKLLNLEKSKKHFENALQSTITLQPKAFSGTYQEEALTWFSKQTEKLSLLSKIEVIVSNILWSKNSFYKKKQVVIVMISLLVLLLSLFLTYLWYTTTRDITRNLKALEKVLNGAIADLKKSYTNLPDDMNDIQTINLDTYGGQSKAYTFLESLVKTAKQDKQEALEASEAKSLFLANMSHEIRTPLNGIIGFTDILKNTQLTHEQNEFVEVIEKSSENLLHIINNILDLSKIESRTIHIDNLVFNPYEEFENSVETYAVNAAQKEIELNFFMDPTIPTKLKGDSTKLKEVLNNLLSNAIKFTPDGGEINVQIHNATQQNDTETKLTFSIQDNGIGISKEQQEHIFDAFTQGDTSIAKEFGGTGLGLAISSQFVTLMGGTLEVESAKSYGTAFFFNLPFEKVAFDTPNEVHTLNKSIAIYRTEKQGKLNKYLQNYFEYFNIKAIGFHDIETLTEIYEQNHIEDIWIDYEKITPSLLHDILDDIGLEHIICMCQITNRKEVERLGLKHAQILLKPVTPSKLYATLFSEFSIHTIKDLDITANRHFNAKALVVEDNHINQQLIATMLKNYSLQVDTASDGLEAFEKYRTNTYDIIFMDIQMPVMSGIQATQEIIEYEKFTKQSHTPIVALTANTLKGDKERYLSSGLDDYLAKPLEKHELLYLLHTILNPKMIDFISPQKNASKPAPIQEVTGNEERRKLTPIKKKNKKKGTLKQKVLLAKLFALENRVLARIMENLGIKYDILEDTQELQEFIESGNYDIVFTDQNLLSSHPDVVVITKANRKKEVSALLKKYRG
jgi:signal transduction histidine kinase/DNA-binding response OmpR family regulator